jgi:hypothetical protein
MDYARPLVKGSSEESLIAIATAFGLEFASCRGRRCRSGYQNYRSGSQFLGHEVSDSTARRRVRLMARSLASLAGSVLLLTRLSSRSKLGGTIASADQGSTASTGYVGSGARSKCHPSIYEPFSRTDMGRSIYANPHRWALSPGYEFGQLQAYEVAEALGRPTSRGAAAGAAIAARNGLLVALRRPAPYICSAVASPFF